MKNYLLKLYYNIFTTKASRAIVTILCAYLILLMMDYSSNHEHKGTICLFKIITGYPCPGCGLGRATLAILHGNIIESFNYNILCIPITLAIFISLVWLFYDFFKNKDTFFKTINRPVKIIFLIPFFFLTALSWYLNIIRGI